MIRGLVVFLALVLVAAAAWFFVSPLFIDNTIDEPLLQSAELPTRDQLQSMPEAAKQQVMSQLMQSAAAAGDAIVNDEAMQPETGPVLLSAGVFSDADAIHKGSGDAKIFQLKDGAKILRLENFKVTNGPALVVLLALSANPTKARDVASGYLKLGELKGNIGNQNYRIPENVDIAQYGSVVIWCDLFDVLFSPAPLKLL